MALIVAGTIYCLPLPSRAADKNPTARLDAVEREIKESERRRSEMERKADSAAHEIEKLKAELVRIARRTQDREAEVTRLERQIETLGARIEAADAALAKRRADMVTMLAALQRIARHPPVALMARPGTPVDTVRSAILIKATVPALESQSEALRGEIGRLFALRDELGKRRTDLQSAAKSLGSDRAKIAALIETKSRLEERARTASSAARVRAAALAAEAKDLKDLLARLEAERLAAIARERRAAEERRRAAQAKADAEREAAEREQAAVTPERTPESAPAAAPEQTQTAALPPEADVPAEAEVGPSGQLVALPSRGRLVHRFGDRTDFGAKVKGLSIATRPAAQVVAPRDGEVVFAGPFRGYGLMLIIRHPDGHHALLSGMAQIHADVGDRLLAGEPIGVMGAGDGAAHPTLYLELRRKGQPVNPLPWLTASRSKVSG